MITTTTTVNQDRISYSYGFKVPGEQQYSSVNASVSLSTDVRDGETPEQAMERARAFVHAQAERDMPGIAPAAPAAAAPAPSPIDREAFDYNNPVHVRLAGMVFDAEGVTSEKARAYQMKNLLLGEAVGRIGELVRKNRDDYQREKAAAEPIQVGRRDGTKGGWNGKWPRRGS